MQPANTHTILLRPDRVYQIEHIRQRCQIDAKVVSIGFLVLWLFDIRDENHGSN